jgi:hypothetical protein
MAALDFPSNPTTGMIYAAPGGSPSYIWDGTKWVTTGYTGGVPTAGFRNAVINGNFDVWQRSISGVAAAGSRFTADRWFVNSAGTTQNPQAQQCTPGAILANEPRYFHSCVVASVAGASNFGLLSSRIEGVRTLAGQVCTLSFWGWADAARPMTVEVTQVFGTGGSPSANVQAFMTKMTLGITSLQRYSFTFTMPSITGKTIGSNLDDYIAVTFWFDAGSAFNAQTGSLGQQSGSFYHSGVQLEPGAVVTPFERRPVGIEMEMCQRYYEFGRTYMGFACPAAGGFAANFFFPFKATKRTFPTVGRSDAGFVNVGGINAISPTLDSGGVQLVGPATAANVTAYTDWTSAAEL